MIIDAINIIKCHWRKHRTHKIQAPTMHLVSVIKWTQMCKLWFVTHFSERWCHILSISRTKTLCLVVLCTTIIVKWQRKNDIDGTVKIKMGFLPGTVKNNSPVNYFND